MEAKIEKDNENKVTIMKDKLKWTNNDKNTWLPFEIFKPRIVWHEKELSFMGFFQALAHNFYYTRICLEWGDTKYGHMKPNGLFLFFLG